MVPTGSSLGLGDTIQDTGVLYGIDTERYTYCMVPTLIQTQAQEDTSASVQQSTLTRVLASLCFLAPGAYTLHYGGACQQP